MGTDLVAYIQYKANKHSDSLNLFSDLPFERNYALFGLLGGVRGGTAIYPCKGLPEILHYQIRHRYYLAVRSAVADCSCEGISRSEAERYVAQGDSRWEGENKNFITHPGDHNPSWLSYKEILSIQTKINRDLRSLWDKERARGAFVEENFKDFYRRYACQEFHTVIAMMSSLHKFGLEPQFVFWFNS